MKRISILLGCTMLCMLQGCSQNVEKAKEPKPTAIVSVKPLENKAATKTTNIIDSGKNYKVLDVSEKGKPKYQYQVLNQAGVVVKKEVVQNHPPVIKKVSSQILSIEIRSGTNSFVAQYYHIEKNLFSMVFDSPLAANESKVVCIDGDQKLVVSDIFNPNKSSKSFTLDFAPTALPTSLVKKVEFQPGNKLRISYLAGKNREVATRTLSLG